MASKLLQRYREGEFEQVWREIRSYGGIDGALRHEIGEVADATMHRVSQNVDILSERLHQVGWHVLSHERCGLRTKPRPQDRTAIDRIAKITGAPIPISLQAFWQIVGGANFVWDYRSPKPRPNLGFALPLEEHDALCVDPAADAVESSEELWGDEEQPAYVYLAPDFLHKANISGGAPYLIELPFGGADPIFVDERRNLPFVDYLRFSFSWAGFPGLADHADRRDVRDFVERFTKGLAPF